MTRVWINGAAALCVALVLGGVSPLAFAQTTDASLAQQPAAVASSGLVAGREAPLMAEDPQLEARLVDISQELRCLVCQNESLASSHAELADDLRREVRELIRSGKSDQEIKDFLVARYGDFVLYRPEVKPLTWVLWFGPFLLFVMGALGLGLYLRQRRTMAEPVVLSDEARERAKQLLKG
jgi:cytochrome c-type biogenesis protein CcmH